MSDTSILERKQFSARLAAALRDAGHADDSPTKLSRGFNARYSGTPVTVHAARKWLVGEAIPTQEKLRTLAQWLGVPAEWLRFGAGPSASGAAPQSIDPIAVNLDADIRRLSEHDQRVVRELVRAMVRLKD